MTDKEKANLEKLHNKIEQMKARERSIIAKEKKRKQRENTRRLIQNGTLAEKYFSCENMQPEQFEKVLQAVIKKLHIKGF